ncbi:MAG: rRNA maturation RNase YbeY [Oscillospiraceae bacterium]|nr:rRNA maturation RNase YbeY [Oscillospiraceae bacterium]
MRNVKISVSSAPWSMRRAIKRAARCALRCEGVDGKRQIAVACVDEESIRGLNARTRNIDKTTDVLSFPSGEDVFLGDVAICLPIVEQQAVEFGHSVRRELSYMTVHSILHLLGYDHVDEGAEKARMRAREKEIMETLGELR